MRYMGLMSEYGGVLWGRGDAVGCILGVEFGGLPQVKLPASIRLYSFGIGLGSQPKSKIGCFHRK